MFEFKIIDAYDVVVTWIIYLFGIFFTRIKMF